jgi:hypothetical protein
MKIEDLFEIEQKQDSGRTKQILSNLYDEDKLDFNTELTSSNISLFTEMDLIAGDDPKWIWVHDFIHIYERKVISLDRKGRREVIGLSNHEHDNYDSRK